MIWAPGASQTRPAEGREPLRVSGAMVVFYSPTKTERDSLAALEGLEIDDLIDDFNLYAGKAEVYLGRKGIPYTSTTSRFIQVQLKNAGTRLVERSALRGPVGILLSDGLQQVSVVPGILSDQEAITAINEFFHVR